MLPHPMSSRLTLSERRRANVRWSPVSERENPLRTEFLEQACLAFAYSVSQFRTFQRAGGGGLTIESVTRSGQFALTGLWYKQRVGPVAIRRVYDKHCIEPFRIVSQR